ncbi:MAG: hypothetical protein M3Z31_12535, partial [Pseudomonadota bacterium]|nr:hypothetical protein [Pseudomonadota bacterium]
MRASALSLLRETDVVARPEVPLVEPRHVLLGGAGWGAVVAIAILALVVVPALNLALPATHPLHVSDHVVVLAGKIMCYAMVALAMDLVWGYT